MKLLKRRATPTIVSPNPPPKVTPMSIHGKLSSYWKDGKHRAQTKLTDKEAGIIIKECDTPAKDKIYAERFGVTVRHVGLIRSGYRYANHPERAKQRAKKAKKTT